MCCVATPPACSSSPSSSSSSDSRIALSEVVDRVVLLIAPNSLLVQAGRFAFGESPSFDDVDSLSQSSSSLRGEPRGDKFGLPGGLNAYIVKNPII